MTQFEQQKKFWSIVMALLILPASNSALYNTSTLIKELINHVQLKNKLKILSKDRLILESKIDEYSSPSGLKRAIKEEINLVENNEIIVKLIES